MTREEVAIYLARAFMRQSLWLRNNDINKYDEERQKIYDRGVTYLRAIAQIICQLDLTDTIKWLQLHMVREEAEVYFPPTQIVRDSLKELIEQIEFQYEQALNDEASCEGKDG